jgi:hypothetical protein
MEERNRERIKQHVSYWAIVIMAGSCNDNAFLNIHNFLKNMQWRSFVNDKISKIGSAVKTIQKRICSQLFYQRI